MDFFSVLSLIGGLAFFLFGMHVLSSNLEKLAGGHLEKLLKRMAAKPIVSFLVGGAITVAMQSSSATTVMLVGLVNSGILQFSQTLYVIFGANVGTTLTAWILSLSGIQSSNFWIQMLKPIHFSPIVALVGILLLMFSKKDRRRIIGTVCVGFALLMYGMTLMSDSVSPLAELPAFTSILNQFGNPVLGLLVALLFTAVVQSSAASIGILQAISLTGSLSWAAVIPMVMGLNIGTCATSLISCIGANTNAKRVAATHLLIKVLGALFFLPLFLILDAIFDWSVLSAAVTPWGIALIHTVYNLLLTLLFMPFSRLLVKLVERLVREKKTADKKSTEEVFVLDERLLRVPSVAVAECDNKTREMCSLACDTLMDSFSILFQYKKELDDKILRQEDRLDQMEDKLGTYLVPLAAQNVSHDESRDISRMLHTIGDFERLGDHAVNLLKLSREIHEKQISFSGDALSELEILQKAVTEILILTDEAYLTGDPTLAVRVEPLEQVIDKLISGIKDNHIGRLVAGNCTLELGFILQDILTNFERISDHCSNIAVALIELGHHSFRTHEYLSGVKNGDDAEFDRLFEQYDSKYKLTQDA